MPASPLPPAPRVSRWEWAVAWLLVATLTWTTLANGGYGARIALVTTGLTGVLAVVHVLALVWSEAPPHGQHLAGWLLLPFLAYALVSVLWITPVPWLGWCDWLGWAQMLVVFWVGLNGLRSRGTRRLVFYTLIGLGIVGVLLGCYQRFIQPEWRMVGPARDAAFLDRASGSFSIPNSFAGFLLLLIPAVVALAIRRTAAETARVWWIWVGLVFLLGLVLTLSRGAWLALAVSLMIWPLVAARGGWRRRAAWAGGVGLLVLALAAGIGIKYPQARERTARLVLESGEKTRPHMWTGAWRLWRAAPLAGTGAGSYNVLFERHRPEGFRGEPLWAHNEYLNTLSDYGAVGFLLFFGAAGFVAVRCLAGPREERRRERGLADPFVVGGLGAGLLAFALQLTLEFHLKIPALAVAGAVVAALAVSAAWPAAESRRVEPAGLGLRLGGTAVAVAIVAGGLLGFKPKLEAEALRSEARRAIDRLAGVEPTAPDYARTVPEARRLLGEATARDPANAQAWADLAFATAMLAHVEPGRMVELGRAGEAAASRALVISQVAGEFWIRRGIARDMQGRWADAGRDFAEAVRLAPADATTWYYYAEHLSRVFFVHEAAEAALDFCLRLDPWNGPGLALRQRLAITKKAPK